MLEDRLSPKQLGSWKHDKEMLTIVLGEWDWKKTVWTKIIRNEDKERGQFIEILLRENSSILESSCTSLQGSIIYSEILWVGC